MKFDYKELFKVYFEPADMEGRLCHKRAHKSGFKERWFKLRYNFLFYQDNYQTGKVDKTNPTGVILLENYNVNVSMLHDNSFAFKITFRNEPQKHHILSARSKLQIEQWIKFIKQASYGYWRLQLTTLQQTLFEKTGEDPLLMYPRNKGIIRDEAWQDKSSFKSHIKSFAFVAPLSTIEASTTEIDLINFT
ncbi:pleckstrin homology domain-containing family J member 1-like isoform X1 [Copidosoma floridanum]|uniref:pleckstrin homology domain-containing family J member 1-like isoform X1 n=1 Tax=Copidosoma floridanum TaxID=29053 RepID=UPI0006C949EF|nr:pleckstrin homology domain-containing family J member 1-like isoform X1 [Copidosoma floridanum]XP_014218794.1 pleckstrin homology domain-containing family J member 1-like isoform X1 [Copidosoma floridanum]